ncbi:MAG: Rv3212 family protein [Pseudonocardiaceae bacterium]
MPAPERRTQWDLTAAAVVTVVVLAAATALWWTSDVRNTTLITATRPAPGVTPAERLPSALAEVWRAPSPATPVPVLQGGTVITGTGVTGAAGEVAGRDLASGSIRWSYRRDLPLCTVAAAVHRVVAVYQRGDQCSEVTTLGWADGRRGPQRNGPVQAPTRLAADGDHVATAGRHYLEVWRTDLVRTLAYGRLPTPAQPDTQPRPDCTHSSMALESGRLALIEHCPAERSARLTVQRAHPKQSDQPEVDFSTPLPGGRAQLVALSAQRVAVALPDPARLLVFDSRGNQVAAHPLAVPDADLRADPPGGLAAVTETPTGRYWFTGSATVALDAEDLRPRWTRTGSRGPGSAVEGRLLLPTPGALSVLDASTGKDIRTLPVDRGGYLGPVGTATSGGLVLEQRGDTLVALR